MLVQIIPVLLDNLFAVPQEFPKDEIDYIMSSTSRKDQVKQRGFFVDYIQNHRTIGKQHLLKLTLNNQIKSEWV